MTAPAIDEDVRPRLPHLPLSQLENFAARYTAGIRVRDKVEAEPHPTHGIDMRKRWRQLEDGTYVSDGTGPAAGPNVLVAVERTSPADLPFIQVIGDLTELDPDVARWLAARLLEAVGIAETAVIP